MSKSAKVNIIKTLICILPLSCTLDLKRESPLPTNFSKVEEGINSKKTETILSKENKVEKSQSEPIVVFPIFKDNKNRQGPYVESIYGIVSIKEGSLGKSRDILLVNEIELFIADGEYLEIIALIKFQDEDIVLLTNQREGTAYGFKSLSALRLKVNEKPVIESFGNTIGGESKEEIYNKRVVIDKSSIILIGDIYKGRKEICRIYPSSPVKCKYHSLVITDLTFDECNIAIDLVETCSTHFQPNTKFNWSMFSNADSQNLIYLTYKTTGFNFKKFKQICTDSSISKKKPSENKIRSEVCSGADPEQWLN